MKVFSKGVSFYFDRRLTHAQFLPEHPFWEVKEFCLTIKAATVIIAHQPIGIK